MPTGQSEIIGFKALSKQLRDMGGAAGGKALRAAGRNAMNIAKKEAASAAPKGAPPYVYSGESYGTLRAFDPYPRPTFYRKGGISGDLVAPGWTSRRVAIKTWLSRDKTQANIMLGVRPDAWQAVQFVELGTSKIRARPWLEPAFRRSISAVDARFRRRLKWLIDRAVTRL